ncbi:MAG TPA: HEAT repeat domain-containing protein [Planctomycetota bacterium]|nr:HEAT repeat domain-containing protein [Planctomycetota bacterium]
MIDVPRPATPPDGAFASTPEPPPPAPPRRRAPWIPFVLLAATVLVPALFWWKNNYGRRLNDRALAAYLAPDAGPASAQHGLNELATRIDENARGVSRGAAAETFYPQVVSLAASPDVETRKAAAWAMGRDRDEARFRDALLGMLDDPEPVVRWNAAASLALHGSGAARPTLLSMLRPFEVRAPVAGTFRADARRDETLAIGAGGRIGRIDAASGPVDLAAPVMGKVTHIIETGTAVAADDVVAVVAAAQSAADLAMKALVLPGVGRPEDAEAVEAFLNATEDLDPQVKAQADLTLKALRDPSRK